MEQFHAGEEPCGVRSEVLTSWRRSRFSGVDPEHADVPYVETELDTHSTRVLGLDHDRRTAAWSRCRRSSRPGSGWCGTGRPQLGISCTALHAELRAYPSMPPHAPSTGVSRRSTRLTLHALPDPNTARTAC